MHRNALRRPVWGSSKACRWACSLVGQSGLPTYPLNPSTPGGPATSRYVKSTIGLDLRSNSARHIPAHRTRCSCYRTNPPPPSMTLVAFQPFLTRSVMRSLKTSLVSTAATAFDLDIVHIATESHVIVAVHRSQVMTLGTRKYCHRQSTSEMRNLGRTL